MNKTLDYIKKEWQIDLSQPSPIFVSRSRDWGLPKLLKELNFTVGAEVGVAEGLYSEILFQKIPNLRLFEIDAWEEYIGYEDYHAERLAQKYINARLRLAPYNSHFIRDFSVDAAKKFKDESLDFVYIDAAHDYEHVKEDLQAWHPKVKHGGIVAGHDYGYVRVYGVVKAVNEWTTNKKIHPLIILKKSSTKSWLYIKP